MQLRGLPLDLNSYKASEAVTNKHFQELEVSEFGRFYLHESMRPFTDQASLGTKQFVAERP